MASRKFALIAFILIDIMAIHGIYMGYQWLDEIFFKMNSDAEIIEFNKYLGYRFFVIVLPVCHIYGIVETLWSKSLLAHKEIIEKAFIIFSISVFVSCYALTNWVPNKLESEGYVYCQTTSVSVASRIIIYTIDDEVCHELGPSKYQQLWDNVLGNQ